MTNPTAVHDLDDRLRSSRRLLQRLVNEIDTTAVQPQELLQRLQILDSTLQAVVEQRTTDRANARTSHLYYVSRLISTSLELDVVLQMVMDAVINLTHANRGFLVLLEDGELTLKTGRNFAQLSLASDDMTISSTIVKTSLESGEDILVENAQEDERFAAQASVISNQLLSVMVSPLRYGDEILGAIYVDNNDYTAIFSFEELELLALFSEQASIAIYNAIEVERREQALRSQISELRIEIDQMRKDQQVAELTNNDDFRAMAEKAKQLRAERNRGDSG